MAKVKSLGSVTKVYDSGISLTNKNIKVTGKFKVGDSLVQDISTRVVSVKPVKPKEDTKPVEPTLDIGVKDE